ncbi:MAG TPA: ribonuclease Y, partial [Epsilonproteobacteria bacterium]|nr:ribonuclease Y [Campylobacterota bacterium]
MLEIIGVSGVAGAVVGSGICYLWIKNSRQKEFSHLELEAKAKAKAISTEAELLLQEANVKIKTKELDQEKEYQTRLAKVEDRNRALILQIKDVEKDEKRITLLENKLLDKETN